MELDRREVKKRFLDATSLKNRKLSIKLDMTTLDMVISFIYKDSTLRTRKTLSNFRKLFTALDTELYQDNPELMSRLWIIKESLVAALEQELTTCDAMIHYCLDNPECNEISKQILEDIPGSKPIPYNDSKFLVRKMDDTLEFGYTIAIKDIMIELLSSIDDSDYRSYKQIASDLNDIAIAIINIKRDSMSLGSDQTFTLDPDKFENIIDDALEKLKDRNRVFITGIQRLNTLLAPGYMSKRLYMFLAFPGRGKSTILLKSAVDIKKYNAGVKTRDPDKRPAVLFLTLENTLEETIERLFNMCVTSDDIRNYRTKEVVKKFRNEGVLGLGDKDNIDIIIKEYKNRELDTNDLYSITNDLADEGVEVIALIIDYIKRIRPYERASDEKTELKNISNELKEYAKYYDVPVITAQQLNRSSASVVDAAIQANKEDVTRLVGRDGIAGAWELLENADFTCIINPETQVETGRLFMTFKMLKRRFRSLETSAKLRRLEYFNHPFEEGNEIKLIDDVSLDPDHPMKSLSLESLATKFEATESPKQNKVINMLEDDETDDKEKKKKKKKQAFSEEMDEFDIFSEDQEALQFA